MNKGTYKKQTEYTANRTLERFFAKYPDSNSVTPEQVLAGVGRDTPEYKDKNDGWLSNRLTGLYAHSLVKPVYSFHPWRKLEKLELTQRGKTVLNRDDAPAVMNKEEDASSRPVTTTSGITYQDLAKAIVAFRNDNPDLDITFEVKLKEALLTK